MPLTVLRVQQHHERLCVRRKSVTRRGSYPSLEGSPSGNAPPSATFLHFLRQQRNGPLHRSSKRLRCEAVVPTLCLCSTCWTTRARLANVVGAVCGADCLPLCSLVPLFLLHRCEPGSPCHRERNNRGSPATIAHRPPALVPLCVLVGPSRPFAYRRFYVQIGYTATYVVGTLSLPGFIFLFYAAIKKGKAEVEEDDAKFGQGRW